MEFFDFDNSDNERKRIDKIQSILKKYGYVTYLFNNIVYKYFDKMKKINMLIGYRHMMLWNGVFFKKKHHMV